MKGYRERVYKAIEVAGGKVKREGEALKPQSPDELAAAMRSWVFATRDRARSDAGSR